VFLLGAQRLYEVIGTGILYVQHATQRAGLRDRVGRARGASGCYALKLTLQVGKTAVRLLGGRGLHAV
jgi:hypothetical protein